MTTAMTVDEALERLREADASYLAVELERSQEIVGLPTPERVIRQVELTAALQHAAETLIKAKAAYADVVKETTEIRQQRAREEKIDIEHQLVGAVADAELAMEDLAARLKIVLDLSKRRYAAVQDATGRASQSLLARRPVAGWIKFRLAPLDLGDLEVADHHHRNGLAQLLGLDDQRSVNQGDQS